MTLAKLLKVRGYRRARSVNRARWFVAEAAAPVMCEFLESRQLLTTYTYTVPTTTPPITAVYLQAGTQDGEVRVRLNSPTGTIGHTFTNTTGMDIVDCGSMTDFLYVDQVPAASKPTSDGNGDNGIKVQGGSGGRLKIEAAAADTLLRITESTSSSATIEVKDTSNNVAKSRFGSGVNKLTIQTSTSGGTDVRVATNELTGTPDLPGLAPQTALRIDSFGVGDEIFLGGAENAFVDAVVRTGAGGNIISLEQNHVFPHADSTTNAVVDFDSTLGGGLGSGNQLLIGSVQNGAQCTATLTQLPGSSQHTLYVDLVSVTNSMGTGTSPGTLILEDTAVFGDLYVKLAEASIEAPLSVESSSSTSGKLFLGTDGLITFTGSSSPSTIGEVATFFGAGEMNLLSGADVTLLTTSHIGALNIPDTTGVLTLQPRASSLDDSRVLRLNSLDMGEDPGSPSGTIDLNDNAMILDYTGDSPIGDINELLGSGYNAGAWDGNGINTSLGDDEEYALGFAEATDLFTSFPGSFVGKNVDNTSVLIKRTFYGDADLDNDVDLDDFDIMATNFNTSGNIWSQGNFNYDSAGNVDLDDFDLFAGNYNAGTGAGGEGFAPESGGYTIEELREHLLNGGGPLKT